MSSIEQVCPTSNMKKGVENPKVYNSYFYFLLPLRYHKQVTCASWGN